MPSPFYHGLIRKYIILFGSLFTDIYIDRVDEENIAQKTLKVPLSYGPKEWYLARYFDNKSLTKEINYTLPRMVFEVVSFRYAPERKLNTTNRVTKVNSFAGTKTVSPAPVPYDIHIRMSILTRNADDGTRIVEQIVPSFTPELTLTLNTIPELDQQLNVPVVLQNVEIDDSYEGNMRDGDRVVIWNLDFVLKGLFHGPISRIGVIKEVTLNMLDMGTQELIEQIHGQPGLTIDGQPASNVAESIPLSEINADDNWSYLVDFMSGSFAYLHENADQSYSLRPSTSGLIFVPTSNHYTTITFIIDGDGQSINAGIKGEMIIPFECQIVSASLIADNAGDIVIDIWKAAFADVAEGIPGPSNSIVGPYKPTLVNEVKYLDTNLIDWNKKIMPDDVLRFNVDSATNIDRVTVSLKVIRTN